MLMCSTHMETPGVARNGTILRHLDDLGKRGSLPHSVPSRAIGGLSGYMQDNRTTTRGLHKMLGLLLAILPSHASPVKIFIVTRCVPVLGIKHMKVI